MSNFICSIKGVRGRSLELYDNKVIIKTDVSLGSILTRNANDGEKTIFYIDCCGLQFKEAGESIGFLQLETSTPQMNNLNSNYYSENSFTFENSNKSNLIMRDIYNYISVRMEAYKYHDEALLKANLPDSLAKIYGKIRPLSIEEEETMKKEEEKERQQAEKERQQAEKERLQKENERAVNYAEKAKKAGLKNAEGFASFLAQSDDLTRFKDIWVIWSEIGLSNESDFSEITSELNKKAEIERLYGPNQDSIKYYLESLKTKYNLI